MAKKGLNISYVTFKIPNNIALLAATKKGVCYISFGKNEKVLIHNLKQEFPSAEINLNTGEERLILYVKHLLNYLNNKTKQLKLPLDVIKGTKFQREVWSFLETIPSGQVLSYQEVAQGIKKPKAVRAVASACARNNLAIKIPCHRVLRSDGTLGGYRWGLELKKKLLSQELS